MSNTQVGFPSNSNWRGFFLPIPKLPKLVGGIPNLLKKYEFVNWDDDILNIKYDKVVKWFKPPTRKQRVLTELTYCFQAGVVGPRGEAPPGCTAKTRPRTPRLLGKEKNSKLAKSSII